MARNSYLPYLSKREDVGLTYFSRTQAKAEACARDFGGRAVNSMRELLGDDPDAVLVLTQETQRNEAALALLAGRPRRLFFEKPLVAQNGQANVCEDDFLTARELLQRASQAGAETAMVFNYRFFDQVVRAQQLIAERGWGMLTQATLRVNYACWSHCIDLLHLFGGRAARIAATAGEVAHQGAVDVSASFRLENGATGTILGTSATHFDFPLYEMQFGFERGLLCFKDLDGSLDIYDNKARYRETHALLSHYARWAQYSASFENSLAAYLDSVAKGVPPPVPGLAGLEELQFEAALRRSAAQQRPVDVQREFPLEG